MLPVAVARSFSDGVAIRYVLHLFISRGQWVESSTTIYLEEVRQVAVAAASPVTFLGCVYMGIHYKDV